MPRMMANSQVKANINLWLNDVLLKEGLYINVSAGETDVYNRNISLLTSYSDPSFADYRVWQSAFKEWVHESGITPLYAGTAAPAAYSGVIVNGVFYPQDPSAAGYSAAFAHKTDYRNGRIIFDSPIVSTSTVQATFAFKEFSVNFASDFQNENREFYVETAYKDNPMQTGVIIYPEPNSKVLPLVMIDSPARRSEPWELGNSSTTYVFSTTLMLWTRDDYTRDILDGIISSKERTTLLGIDFNTAPFPLTYLNDKNPSYTNYDNFATLTSPYFWHRIYVDEISSRKIQPFYDIERTQIDLTVRVYPNF
jgi:hypothetical protein